MNPFVASVVNGLGFGFGLVLAVTLTKILFHAGIC